jgi:hypothetical protein
MKTQEKKPRVVLIKQSDILKCPFCIIDMDHYREDGSCKCNDPEHRAFMIANWEYKETDFANVPPRKP